MKTKPFNTADVQAIIEGRKTMFREVIKLFKEIKNPIIGFTTFTPKGMYSVRGIHENGEFGESFFYLPHKVNDIIAVKEAWQHTRCLNINPEDENYGYVYKSDDQPWSDLEGWKWHSPVTMPPEAHRLFIKITGVKAERLQDISAIGILSEGIEEFTKDGIVFKYGIDGWDWSTMPRTLKEAYQRLHNISREQWQSNQWHFAYSFKVVEKP